MAHPAPLWAGAVGALPDRPVSAAEAAELKELELSPLDVHNATLLDCVHPRGHPDPDPVRCPPEIAVGETVISLTPPFYPY